MIHLLEEALGCGPLFAQQQLTFARRAALTSVNFERFKQLHSTATQGTLCHRRPRLAANTVPAVVRMLNFALLAGPSGPLYVHTSAADEHPGRKVILEHRPSSRTCAWSPEFAFLIQRLYTPH